ncbi:hypothetical protein Pfo_013943 [Paulownia fortunei]|nr:hypothetical protein Pfo_013943 [Paulownia fortunei]
MIRERLPSHILHVLLEQVEDILNHYKQGINTNNQLGIPFRKIEEDLKEIKSAFCLPKESEDAFKFLAKDLNDLYLNDHGRTEEKTAKKISHISQQLEDIKRLSSQILETGKKASSSPQQHFLSNFLPRKMSEYWSKLLIEEQLLLGHMVDSLQLSYDLLPVKLRLCSLFFSVFPERAVIKKKPLIYWWIAEGIMTKTSTMTAEEAGEEAFRELIEKGLIQAWHKSLSSPVISGCTVNPCIRRMLISKARQANFFDLDEEGKISDSYHNSRRAIKDHIFNSSDSDPKGELLAIFNMSQSYLSINEEFLSRIEKLKVLQLGRWQSSPRHHIEIEDGKFLDKLVTQRQLRYLSLRGISRITTLPSSILRCQNLEILDLRSCHNLEKLPSDIGSLKKLTHFMVSECYLLEGLPKGLEKISSLQVIKGFVTDHWRKNPCLISSLTQLEKLRKLSIYVGRGSIESEFRSSFRIDKRKGREYADEETEKETTLLAIRAQAQVLRAALLFASAAKDLKIENLRVLTITWQMSSTNKYGEQSKQMVSSTDKEDEERRRDPFASVSLPMLEKLDLKCFPSQMLPLWISPANLGNLKRLYIRGGKLKTLLPMADSTNPWKLEILRLNCLKNFQFGASFDMQKEFPSLLYFERIKCHRSSKGTFDADIEWKRNDGWQKLGEKLKNAGNA